MGPIFKEKKYCIGWFIMQFQVVCDGAVRVCDYLFELNKIGFYNSILIKIEEMSWENNQFTTTLQKCVSRLTIEGMLQRIVSLQKYWKKSIQNRCLDSQFIIKIALYVIIREGGNQKEIAMLQFEIKKTFALMPALSKSTSTAKHLQHQFLFEILLLSQITYQIILQIKIPNSHQVTPQTIFIILVFLSTDKLVSSACYELLNQRFKKKKLPFAKHPSPESLTQLKQFYTCESSEAECFKEEVRSIIHPKQAEKSPLKNLHSVGIMLNKFSHKENINHYNLTKELRQNHSLAADFSRTRKCHSQQSTSISQMNNDRSNKGRKEYTWSKCELLKTHYIPFCNIKPPTPPKNKSLSNSSFKFKLLKQKTVHFQENQHHVLLKI